MQLSVQLRVGEANARGAHPSLAATAQPADLVSEPPFDTTESEDADTTLLIDPAVGAFQGPDFSPTDLRASDLHESELHGSDEDTDDRGELTACLYEMISEELRGIERLGAEVKELGIGLTVFPSFLDGSVEVLLAWTVAETEVRSFFTPQGGYRTRKSVEGCRFTDGRTPAGQLRE